MDHNSRKSFDLSMDIENLDEVVETRTNSNKDTYKTDQTAFEIDQDKVDEAFQEFRTKHRVGFDPYKKADFRLARIHREAKLVKKLEGFDVTGEAEVCECCYYPVNAPKFPICANLSELNELGPGFHMYYLYIKYLIGLMVVGLLVVGLPCWIDNLQKSNAHDWDLESDGATKFYIDSSVGGQGKVEEIMPFWHSALNVVFMMLVLISYHLLRRKLVKKEEEIDISITTPSDYTVIVKGLPKQVTEEEVRNFFQENGRSDGKPAKVMKVNFPYDISEYVAVNRRAESIKQKIKFIDEQIESQGELPQIRFCCCCKKDMESKEELQKELVEVNEKIKKFDQETEAGVGRDLLVKQAFVTFETQADARAVEDRFGKDFITHFWQILFNYFGCGKIKQSYFFKGRSITAQIAPEPTDIYWENLGVRAKKRAKYISTTYCITLVALGVSFGIIYGRTALQKLINESIDGKVEKTTLDNWVLRLNSIWPAVFTIFFNFLLGLLIRYFSSFERHHTITDFSTSVAFKLTLAQFVNTALIVMVVNSDWEDQWFITGGLASAMTTLFITNAIIPPLHYYLSPMYCIRRYKMRRAQKKGFISQGSANDLFEGPPVNMAKRYANVTKTMLMTFFYAPILPVSFLISGIALFVEYWVDKYLLLRRHARPNRLSGDLANYMTKTIPWAVLVYSIMNYIYMELLNPGDSTLAFVWLMIVIGYIFIPIELLFGYCKKIDVDKFERMYQDEKYEDAAVYFMEDYDRENPVTNNQGWRWYIDLLERKNAGDNENIEYLKGFFGTQGIKNLISQSIQNYSNDREDLSQVGKKNLNKGLLGLFAPKVDVEDESSYTRKPTSNLLNLKSLVGERIVKKNPAYATYSNQAKLFKFKKRKNKAPKVTPGNLFGLT